MKKVLIKIAAIAFLLLGIGNASAFAQQITGIVKDALGPVAGAAVMVQGTTTGASTDLDGKFTLP
ncbi:MAG: carboxypeptidase-like regulatory domain-containing protein, partial [Bacteroidales bacterium]|nr:carboxypeptidase-like regulatory domain-containing protein [Bacteroidales bacterium]